MKKLFYILCIISLPFNLLAQNINSVIDQRTIVKSPVWLTRGNSGTNPAVNFLGTKDKRPLVFRVNDQISGYIDFDSLKGNTSFGYRALQINTSIFNTSVGYKALSLNTNGQYNAATGAFALFTNSSGLGNTANGAYSLFNNTSGSFNTAIGEDAMYGNTFGSNNVAIGNQVLVRGATGSNNTAMGSLVLYFNTGSDNTALGANTLYDNTTGSSNVATGEYSLFINTTGNNNTAIGNGSMFDNSTGSNNTALGNSALFMNTTGTNNTAVGYNANEFFGNLTNATAIGYSAFVDSSNKVRLGNDMVTSVGGEVDFTNYSADNIKTNIRENVPGLQFIKKLKPVTYNLSVAGGAPLTATTNNQLNAKANKFLQSENSKANNSSKTINEIRFTGFIASEVHDAAKSVNYNFSGVDKNGVTWGLRYAEFVVPLVKAVQELSDKNDEKDSAITSLKNDLAMLQNQINDLKEMLNSSNQNNSFNQTGKSQTSGSLSASLEQNTPNPFSNSTTINYGLPQTYSSAKIIITNSKGNVLKELNVSGSKGSIQLDASAFSSGIYQYTLLIDGKVLNTKQMILAK